MSVDILLGYTGLASLGQAAYLAVGAYAAAILATSDAALAGRLRAFRAAQTDSVAERPE